MLTAEREKLPELVKRIFQNRYDEEYHELHEKIESLIRKSRDLSALQNVNSAFALHQAILSAQTESESVGTLYGKFFFTTIDKTLDQLEAFLKANNQFDPQAFWDSVKETLLTDVDTIRVRLNNEVHTLAHRQQIVADERRELAAYCRYGDSARYRIETKIVELKLRHEVTQPTAREKSAPTPKPTAIPGAVGSDQVSASVKSKRTTLILGAGLGKEYGFPDGRELRKLVADELPDQLHELKHAFLWSPYPTVDAIAADNPNHILVVKQSVLKILREREDLELLKRPSSIYMVMLHQIMEAQQRGDEVRIVTFNYDRSLQHLLFLANQAVPQHKRIAPNIIRTVYGRLPLLGHEDVNNRGRKMLHHTYGPPFAQEPEYQFEREEGDEAAVAADHYIQQQQDLDDLYREARATGMAFIGEQGRANPADITRTLEKSDRIFLLGVGYHSANMDVLGFDFRSPCPDKIIAGTGYGHPQIDSIMREFPAIRAIENCKASDFLEYKFNIAHPERDPLKAEAPNPDRPKKVITVP